MHISHDDDDHHHDHRQSECVPLLPRSSIQMSNRGVNLCFIHRPDTRSWNPSQSRLASSALAPRAPPSLLSSLEPEPEHPGGLTKLTKPG